MAVQKETGSSQRIIRFGVFEADLAAGELRKNGLKIKLRGQPFEVLAILLERPGEVVTREELQKRLWPDGTFVDFDHSLNTAINKIREALSDSAENPRFVETLSRRGYRFIAPVEARDVEVAFARTDGRAIAHVDPPEGRAAEPSAQSSENQAPVAPVLPSPLSPNKQPLLNRRKFLAAAVLVLLLLVAFFFGGRYVAQLL